MMSLETVSTTAANSLSSAGPIVKKRASQACHHCRSRKVKCSLVKSGVPCHNCSSDGIECVILESKRSRKYRLQKRQLNRKASLSPELPPPNNQAKGWNDFDPFRGRIGSQAQAEHDTPIIPALITPTIQSPSSIFPSTSTGTPSQARATNVQPQGRACELPAFIRPPRSDIRQDDLEFLGRRGAFNLPPEGLRDQLIKCFALYVYPYMPIVDLEDFLGAIDGSEAAPQISLIVYQAILFSATAFVDQPLLREAGYENRRAARSDYYQKVKLLYDFDWDVDRVALIQSLLMINYWYVSENDQKDPWHWLGICVSLATSIGVNQLFAYAQKDQKTSALWRRIWWCCIYRDRINSISMRRPMRVKNEDIRLSPLSIDDFEVRPVDSTIPALQGCAFVTDRYTRTMLAEMFVAKVKLLVHVGEILNHFYHLRGFGGSTAEPTMLYTPKRTQVNSQQYLDLQRELDQWHRDLPPSCWPVAGKHDMDAENSTADALLVHRSVLRMLYLVATEALNRPQSLSKSTADTGTSPTSKVKEAAEKIAEMVESMQERDLIRFLPPLSVSCLLLALSSFLVDIKTKVQSVGALPGQQFHVCVRALLRLREIWPIADAACFLIGQMITKHPVSKVSVSGFQPTPTDAPDPSTDVWRNPETPRTYSTPTLMPPSGHLDGGAEDAYEPHNIEQPIYQAQDGPVMTADTTATPGFTIPYNWTEEDFEGAGYRPMIDAHALNMDLAMPDADILGFFGNGAFDSNFEPSPNNDHPVGGQDFMSFGSQQPATMTDEWNTAITNSYMDSFQTTRGTW